MNKEINFDGRKLSLILTPSAERALNQRKTPLLAEMELYFSCLIRKTVRFREEVDSDGVFVNEVLAIRFRPVMTQHCGTDYHGDEPPLTDFPIIEAERYIPHWLKIDYKAGNWHGEFGYAQPAGIQ